MSEAAARSVHADGRPWLRAARALAALAAALGAAGLAGWLGGVPAFIHVVPGLVAMQPSTAVALLALGLALGVQGPSPPRAAGVAAAAAAGVAGTLGALALGEHLLGVDTGAWQAWPWPGPVGTAAPARMAGSTALAVVLLSVCVLARDRHARLADGAALAAGVLAMLALLGYAVGAPALYALGGYASMAVHTATAVVALAAAAIAGRPRRGVAGLLRGQDPGAQLARVLLPAVVLVPALVLVVRLHVPVFARVPAQLGAALGTVTLMVLLALIVDYAARRLRRLDAARARHEAAATVSQARVLAAFETAFFGHSVSDLDGRLLEVNDAYCALVGAPREALLGRSFAASTHPQDRAADHLARERMRRGEIARYFTEKRYVHPTRGVVWALLSVAPLRDRAGQPFGFHAQVVDLTERKRAEAARDALARELAQFSYAAAHDLRAPLRHVDGFAAALREHLGDRLDAEGARMLARIGDAARHMGALVDALLAFAQLSRRPHHPAWTDVGGVARELIASLPPETPPVRWQVDTPHPVWADGTLLRRALAELLANARQATAGRGTRNVHVSTAARDGGVAVCVRDDGVGFDPSQAGGLFAPFAQLPGSAPGGLGMGLAMVRRIAELHDGWAEAHATPGAGADFTLVFPTPAAAHAEVSNGAAPDSAD